MLFYDGCMSYILLGRPWRYDGRAFHDGFKNTYSFEKDGTKITLAPLKYLLAMKSGAKLEALTTKLIAFRKGFTPPL
jgi:hypothetical protein